MAGIGNDFQISSLRTVSLIGSDRSQDSYGGMKGSQEQVQLAMKCGGGVGHDLSHIRPERQVKNSALTSTGIVPFMERFSSSTREVGTGCGRRVGSDALHSMRNDRQREFC